MNFLMNLKFMLLWIMVLSSTCESTDPSKRDVAWARIIAVEPNPTENRGFPSPLSPVTRSQFKNTILFRIHPDSPVNREAWIKSGFMSRESPPTRSFFSLLTPKQPKKTDLKGLKAKRPSSSVRRRTSQQNDTTMMTRRVPKLDRFPEHHNRLSGNAFVSPGRSTYVVGPSVPMKVPLAPAVPLPTTPIILSPISSSSYPAQQQPARYTSPLQKCFMQIPYSRPILPLPFIQYLIPTSWNPQFVSFPIDANEVDQYGDSSNQIAPVKPTSLASTKTNITSAEDLTRSDIILDNAEVGSTLVAPSLKAVDTTATLALLEVKSTEQSGNSPSPQIIDVEFREDAVPQMNTKHELYTTTASSNDGNGSPKSSFEETWDKLAVVPVEAIPAESDGKNSTTESRESLLSPKQNGPVSTRAAINETTLRE